MRCASERARLALLGQARPQHDQNNTAGKKGRVQWYTERKTEAVKVEDDPADAAGIATRADARSAVLGAARAAVVAREQAERVESPGRQG
jgi:hypothetical protein